MKAILANWRSTLAGLALLLAAIARLHSAADLLKPELQAQLMGGVGLILAADAKKKAA